MTFRIPPVAQEQKIEPFYRSPIAPDPFRIRPDDPDEFQSGLSDLRARVASSRVTRGDVSDFMAENPGEFSFVTQIGKQTPRDVDIATGHGERIRNGVVYNAKPPRSFGLFRRTRHTEADLLDVLLEGIILVKAPLLAYRGASLPVNR